MSAEPSSILRHGPLTRFWLARVATSVAYQMQAVAVGWQLYDLTRNPVDLGLVGLIQFIPVLLLILVTGQIVDRHDRGMVLALAQAVEVAGALVLALATRHRRHRRAGDLLHRVRARRRALVRHDRARSRCCPAIVPPAMMTRAVAVVASSNQAATIAGPALGGVLYIAGPSVVYLTCCALSLAATLLVLGVRVERTAARREPFSTAVLFAGVALHPQQPDRARRAVARPVRGAARRRDRAAADLRARRVRGRAVGPRHPARRAGGRRAGDLGRADAGAAAQSRRPRDVRGGGGVRRRHDRVRLVDVARAHAGRARGARRRPTCSASSSARRWCSSRRRTRCAGG